MNYNLERTCQDFTMEVLRASTWMRRNLDSPIIIAPGEISIMPTLVDEGLGYRGYIENDLDKDVVGRLNNHIYVAPSSAVPNHRVVLARTPAINEVVARESRLSVAHFDYRWQALCWSRICQE